MGQELELRWQEYYELVTMLLQWIRHHIVVFEESKFPTSYEEIEVSYWLNKTQAFTRHTFTCKCSYCIVLLRNYNLISIISYFKFLF